MVRSNLSTEAADVVRRRILDGTFPPGSQLPAERILCEELGLSRTALRDALMTLQAHGYIEVQIGRGRFVAEDVGAGRSAAAATSLLHLHRHDLEDLNEVRQLLEPQALRSMPKVRMKPVAALAADVVDRQVLAVRSKDYAAAAELDSEFHTLLVAETPNTLLRVLAEKSIAMAAEHAERVYKAPGAAAHSISQHEEIVRALEMGDLRLAVRLVRQHAKTAFRFALDKMKDPT